jgi:hypothetical protein
MGEPAPADFAGPGPTIRGAITPRPSTDRRRRCWSDSMPEVNDSLRFLVDQAINRRCCHFTSPGGDGRVVPSGVPLIGSELWLSRVRGR